MADESSTGSTGTGSGATKRRSSTAAPKKSGRASTSKATRPSTSGTAKATATKAATKPASTKAAASRRPTTAAAKPAAAKVAAAKPAAAKPAASAKPVAYRPAAARTTEVIVVPAAFDAHNGPMTPTIAVTRHLEWLDYALAAARAEEGWRRGRLEKATNKNRAKRETRLAEVVAEIDELAALLVGLRAIQKPAAARGTSRRRSTGSRASRTGAKGRAVSRISTGTGAG